MANAYAQIQVHTVLAVENRASLIGRDWRGRLYEYIVSVINCQRHKALAIGGTHDHVHILIGLNTTQTVTELVRRIKKGSSEWVNRNGFTSGKFEWQSGYGAFSHSKSQVQAVARYIKNQEKHHAKVSFSEEYKKILDNQGIEYDKRFLFRRVK
jgi:REP element-mobilizing transposase RayT